MAHQARHYGIQVNNYDGLVSVGLKEDIVDLGVVMGHPQRQLSCLIEVGKTTGLLLHRLEPLHLLGHLGSHAHRILRHIGKQFLIALAGVVEIGNGHVELLGVKVGQQHLELAKGLAGTAHHFQVGAGIISAGGNVVEQAPEPVVIKEIDLPVRRMVKVQNGTLGLLGVDVLGHLIDVLHNLYRLFEYKGIHRLDDIGLGPSIRPQIIDLIGAVYIPTLISS